MKFSLCVVTLSVGTALATPSPLRSCASVWKATPWGEALEARVGDIIGVQIIADFQSQRATGLADYLSLPEDLFQVQDLGLSGQQGTQPFRKGPLFAGAHLQINRLLPESDDVAAEVPGQQLDLAALFGLDSVGEADGKGVRSPRARRCGPSGAAYRRQPDPRDQDGALRQRLGTPLSEDGGSRDFNHRPHRSQVGA
jgi:hypothetical protein